MPTTLWLTPATKPPEPPRTNHVIRAGGIDRAAEQDEVVGRAGGPGPTCVTSDDRIAECECLEKLDAPALPPAVPTELATTVQFVSVIVATLPIPPPVPLAELPVTVVFVIAIEPKTSRPPPY